MSEQEALRGASERDDWQMPLAADEGQTPPGRTLRSGENRVAGVCWAGPGNQSMAGRMEFSGTTLQDPWETYRTQENSRRRSTCRRQQQQTGRSVAVVADGRFTSGWTNFMSFAMTRRSSGCEVACPRCF